MKSTSLTVLAVIGFVLAILAADYTGFLWESFMAPQREQLRREVREQSTEFKEGQRQTIVKYYKEWKLADTPDKKAAVCSIVSMEFGDEPKRWNMAPKLNDFINECL